jgi:Zn-dependent peptidase ImmA (M78 family)
LINATPIRTLTGLACNDLAVVLRSDEPPFEQAYQIANWLRSKLNIIANGVVLPDELLDAWGVITKTLKLPNREIDALAFWGPKHGPAVVVNQNGKHSRSQAGRRATLAHEIFHLIVDRARNLPLADIIGGNVVEQLEHRARAFAAELLLPHRVAYEEFLKTDESLHEVSQSLGSMMKGFRVSRWIAAYQLKNGLRRFHRADGNVAHILAYIDTITADSEH